MRIIQRLLLFGVTFVVLFSHGCRYEFKQVQNPLKTIVRKDVITRSETLAWMDGKIAFESSRPALFNGNVLTPASFLYLMSLDGTEIAMLNGTFPHLESPVAWSPDGMNAFSVVYVKEASSFCLSRISPEGIECLIKDGYVPSISPDGTQIAYYAPSYREEGKVVKPAAINIYQLEEKALPRQLIELPEENGFSFSSWSYDGRHLAYEVQLGEDNQIWIYSFDTSKATFITQGEIPVFSPVKMELAFARDRSIYVYDFERNQEERLDLPISDVFWPSWSPDGTKLLFTTGNIYYYDFSTGKVFQLTKGEYSDEAPSWRP